MAMRAAVAANPTTAAPVAAAGLAATCPAVAPPILNNAALIARTPAALPAVAVVAAPPPAVPAVPVPRPLATVLAVPIEASTSLALAIVPALSAAGKASGRPTMMRRASRCASIASRQCAHSSRCARRAARPWLPPSPPASAARDRSMRRHWMLAAWTGGAIAVAPAPSATFWYSSRKRARARKSNTCTLLDVEPSARAISAELRPPISRMTRAARCEGANRCRVARTAS